MGIELTVDSLFSRDAGNVQLFVLLIFADSLLWTLNEKILPFGFSGVFFNDVWLIHI